MPCYHPYDATRKIPIGLEKSKLRILKRGESLPLKLATGYEALRIPCGHCIGCRLEYSRQWALRCLKESTLHKCNSFVTLTYDDLHLRILCDGENNKFIPTLYPKDFTTFVKRLRKRLSPVKIRYMMCGEYGERKGRPHFHAIIFGYDFPDKKIDNTTRQGDNLLYVSQMLSELWPHGKHVIGDVTFESAAYVARYVTKKQIGGDKTYNGKHKEYARMSRNPGLAKGYYDKYGEQIYDNGYITARGIKMQPPKYFDKMLENDDVDYYNYIKSKRKEVAQKTAADNSRDRLHVKEKIKKRKLKQLKRGIENGSTKNV